MSEKFTLVAEKRESAKNSSRDVRNKGKIPAIVYGKKFDSVSISVDYSDFLRTFRKTKQSALIDLKIEGKEIPVLVHQYSLDPVKDTFKHVDFFAVNLKEKTMVRVPLIFTGESDAVKNLGGTFISNHSELEIRCLPSEIPQNIQIDIACIKDLHDHITITDLNLSENLEVMYLDPETVLCTVTGRSNEDEETMEGEESSEDEPAEKTE